MRASTTTSSVAVARSAIADGPEVRRFVKADHAVPDKSGHFVDLRAGACERCGPECSEVSMHCPYQGFEFIRSGRGWVRLADKSFEIGPGSIYFFDPDLKPQVCSRESESLLKYRFNFARGRIDVLLNQFGLRAGTVTSVSAPARVGELLEEAMEHALSGKSGDLCASAIILEHALALCGGPAGQQMEGADLASSRYIHCRAYLVKNFASLQSVTQVAKGCAVTPSYLSRLFKRFDHETPYQLLRRLRMEEARRRLRAPNSMAKTVAIDLGFGSLAHFSRVFKQYHGLTPQEVKRTAL